ncbi:unnamed protein product [Cuscuta campestris]|uniref:Uncharacterized protein n=1 Tax=Cuscuta campestris TaxID=132261 RepID=A0A484MN95_9ASTE|nr:unnamed protein product [Cuscuta campestris]
MHLYGMQMAILSKHGLSKERRELGNSTKKVYTASIHHSPFLIMLLLDLKICKKKANTKFFSIEEHKNQI